MVKFFTAKTSKPRGLFFLLLPLLSACVYLSPVETEGPPPKFSGIEALVPQWEPFARETAPGIDYFAGSIQEPRLEFRALRVDLTEPSLRIVINENSPPENQAPEPADAKAQGMGTIPGIRVSDFVRRYGCLAGINTAPFRLVPGEGGEKHIIVGLSIANGRLISPPNPSYAALIFYKDGRAAIRNQAEAGDIETIENAAGGFFIILQEGNIAERLLAQKNESGGPAPRHPRSAGGLSSEGRCLYLLVIDGRQSGSTGATEEETGLLLKQLGAFEGINFDGGGSTALALRYPGGRVRTANTPVHNGIPGWEREVAACLGIAPLLNPSRGK